MTPVLVFVVSALLLAMTVSCTPGENDSPVRPALTQTLFAFRFPEGDAALPSALEIHLSDRMGAEFAVLTLLADGQGVTGVLADMETRHPEPFAWVTEFPEDPSLPVEQAPTAQPRPAEDPAVAGDALPEAAPVSSGNAATLGESPVSPADPGAPVGGSLVLGTLGTDGTGDGWIRNKGGTRLLIPRSLPGDLVTLDIVLVSGTCQVVNLSRLDLEGRLAKVGSRQGPGEMDMQHLVASLGPRDQGLVVEINGADGWYGADAGTVEVRGTFRTRDTTEAAGTPRADGIPPEGIADLPGESPSPAPEASLPPEETASPLPGPPGEETDAPWHQARLVLRDGVIVVQVDDRDVARLATGPSGWGGTVLRPQRLPGVEFRNLVTR